jgi:hypothetical protein
LKRGRIIKKKNEMDEKSRKKAMSESFLERQTKISKKAAK